MTGLISVSGFVIKYNNGAITLGSSSGGGSGGSGNAQPLAITFQGIVLPSTNLSENCPGQVFATGGLGQYTYNISQVGESDISYTINNQGVLNAYIAAGSVVAPRNDTATVTVTDGTGATASVVCNIQYRAGPQITPSALPVFYNSQTTNGGITFVGVSCTGPGFDQNASVAITDVTGVFSGNVYLFCHQSTWPAPGSYPLTIVATQNGNTVTSNAFSVVVVNDPGPSFIQWTQTNQISSSLIIGTVVGQALADGSSEITTYALSNNANGKYSINGITGVISVSGALTTGTDTIVIKATRVGQSLSKSVSIVVSQGNTLSPTNMTMTVATNLTNWVLNPSTPRAVGTPSVTGISGTPVWTLDQNSRCYWDEDPANTPGNPAAANNPSASGHGHARYVIDSSTGVITTQAQLSAQTDTLIVSCTDGINTCTRSFNVVVNALVGPTLYVGQGMSALHGANGFEHFAPLYKAMNYRNAAYAGATIYIMSNSDPNYYANDNTMGDSLSRAGFFGPATIIGVQGAGGPAKPRMGGTVGSLNEGVDEGGKGFFVISEGDITISNIEFSDVHANSYQGPGSPESNVTGAAIRQNGNIWGNLTVTDCYFHQCDQGIETGDVAGSVTLNNLEIANCGAVYVGSGATHNIYLGHNAQVTATNILSYNCLNGHTFKTRCYNGTISNCRFYDGELGGASNQLDICDGGIYTVSNCVFHKGTQPQNPISLQFCEEIHVPLHGANLTVQNCTFISNTPTNFATNAIYMNAVVAVSDGSYSSVTAINNSYIGYLAGTTEVSVLSGPLASAATGILLATGVSDGRSIAINSSGATTLSAQPALDFTNPQTGVALARQGAFYCIYDGENRNNWVNFLDYQMDIGTDDARFPASTTTGTALFTATVFPSTYATGAPSFTNLFATNVVWSIVAGAGPYVGGFYGVAPVGRYTINSSTGVFTLAQAVTSGTRDNVILRATASNGHIAQQGFYIVWT